MHPPRRTRTRRGPAAWSLLLASWGLTACGGAGGTGDESVVEGGEILEKPGTGEVFLQDTHREGRGSRLELVDAAWGRLVDVHDLDPVTGEASALPLLRDYVIDESVQDDGVNYRLERNPITLEDRLIVLRTRGVPDTGRGSFDDLVRRAAENLPPILARGDDPSAPGPFSFVARNAVIVLTFDDLLDDRPEVRSRLGELVRVYAGSPPVRPFQARILFDPSHGGVVGGSFHSSRILIDPTVSEAELAASPVPLALNAIGLPARPPGPISLSGSIRIPTRRDPDSGQFELLRSLGGKVVDFRASAPADTGSPTRDVVRGFRAGNSSDSNNGFLLDFDRPVVLGSFQLDVTRAVPAAGGRPGVDFVLDVAFVTTCQRRPSPGDVVAVGGSLLEVSAFAAAPDPVTGAVPGLRVQVAGGVPIEEPNRLLGRGAFQSAYQAELGIPDSCWATFSPTPAGFPAVGVSPNTQITLRFSEPVDPSSLSPSSSLLVTRGGLMDEPNAVTNAVGSLTAAPDSRVFTFRSQLPLGHEAGTEEEYTLRLDTGPRGVHDLAGNGLSHAFPPFSFLLDAGAPTTRTAGILLTFDELDEYQVGAARNKDDLRGQFFYDLERGLIRPRAAARASYPIDPSHPVTSAMTPFTRGVQTPLAPLGSKLQWVWRYCDAGWLATDETKYDLDVEGLGWSPANGFLLADFFERFEIRVSHSKKLPDEYIDPGLVSPAYQASGLFDDRPYTLNILGEQVVVHNRDLGYEIDPLELSFTSTGTPIAPFPWNRVGGPHITYTWRDTSVDETAGPAGAGIPLAIEAEPPLLLYGNTLRSGDLAGPDEVPTYGLPLLMEIRCFPSDRSIGLNALALSLATVSSARPNFRTFSTGGIDVNKTRIKKDPDLEIQPTGGFNPSSNPPGQPSIRADNGLYWGQLDVVVRVSRLLTIWFDTQVAEPDFAPEVLEPRSEDLPPGTSLLVEFRGANSFVNTNDTHLDAREIDPYGLPSRGRVRFQNGSTWKPSIEDIDGSPFFQVRVTFVSDIETGLVPELEALGVAYEAP